MRARVTARGVHDLGAGLRALGPDIEAQFLQTVLLVTHDNVRLLSSGSGERMDFRYRTPCGYPDFSTASHQFTQTRQAEILFSVTEFDGDDVRDERARHEQRLIVKRTLRESILIVEKWADIVNDPIEPKLRIRLFRKPTNFKTIL